MWNVKIMCMSNLPKHDLLIFVCSSQDELGTASLTLSIELASIDVNEATFTREQFY